MDLFSEGVDLHTGTKIVVYSKSIRLTSHILVTILAGNSRIKGVIRMKKNMGGIDRFIRVVIGIAALILALFYVGGAWGIVLWVVAAITLISAVLGFCPSYVPFKISTKK